MKTHSKCENPECNKVHSVHSLILTHGKLLCRICHIEECGRIPIPKKNYPRKLLKHELEAKQNGDAE